MGALSDNAPGENPLESRRFNGNPMNSKVLLSLTLFVWLAAGCTLPTTPVPTAPPESQVATFVAATLDAVHTQETAQGSEAPAVPPLSTLLPHSVYALIGPEGDAQVWRLSADGQTQTQLTHEAGGVDGYAVSPDDGRLALVVDNQLILLDPDSGERAQVAAGVPADPDSPAFFYRGRISDPSFSPDGRILAYAYNGLHLYDVASGDDLHVLVNQVDEPDSGLLVPEEIYFPGAWASDDRRLVVDIASSEGSSLGVVDWTVSDPLTPMNAGGILCCQVSWAPDNGSILVASPFLGLVSPGLWRYDARTGAEGVLVAGNADSGTFEFAGWPLQLPDGTMRYFYASTTEVPEGDVPLLMVSSGLDGQSDRTTLRPESFNIREALWAEDGSLVLIRLASGGTGSQVVLVWADGRPLQVLLGEARDLAWGP